MARSSRNGTGDVPKEDSYRRHLPHLRRSGGLYFVTWRLDSNQTQLEPEERSVVLSALKFFDEVRYVLNAWVVMDDHVHVIVRPRAGFPLKHILHSWKSFTAHRLVKEFGRKSPVWQSESFDRLVRGLDELAVLERYILENPRNRWPDLQHYSWVGSRNSADVSRRDPKDQCIHSE